MAQTVDLTTKNKIIGTVLTVLATGGLVSVALLAPNALKLLAPLARQSKWGLSNRRYYLRSTIGRLADRGLIKFKHGKGGKTYATLTALGQTELLKYRLANMKIHRPRRWDGRWRVVIYDVKETKRRERGRLRREIGALGFVRLQNSVWVYPYECDEFVTLLKTYYGLGRSLLYLTADRVEDDSRLKKLFNL